MLRRILIICLALLLCFSALFMCGCVEKEWHTCMKCGGSGYMTNSLGYKVRCTRCNGVGKMYY